MSIRKQHQKWKTNNDILKAISLLGQLGLLMASSILLFILLGVWIDRQFSLTGIGVALCSLFGILCGGFLVFRLLEKYFKE